MSKTSETNNNVILEVKGLKKYFPVHRGFLQRVVGWIKAVDGVDLGLSAG
ncbi:MAG: peptide ABC transporter ATP-binding protein, partial [Deltaproteobacteria bacterium]|nr:peptide ABC transporter ATP-binding protein [Deltaproteobacteria bacterium]